MTLMQAELDALWDFADAAASESRFRDAAATRMPADERDELETQIARCLGLQGRYVESDETLDAITSKSPAVRARIALERGRLRNSQGDTLAAVPLFETAAEVAASADLLFLRIDALHMLAIADGAHESRWSGEALDLLGATNDARTLRWTVTLHNNIGWTHLEAGRLREAVAAFERARDAATRWGTPQQVRWADDALAEARRAV